MNSHFWLPVAQVCDLSLTKAGKVRDSHNGRSLPYLSKFFRVAACSAQNQELQKKVQELERHNM